ncbi:type II toxin-antitoxin system VapC family toxin [Pseudonocardia sp. DSM 110487]|uniref:type II toxin-antitoxin system VapC family toxin n=1 Tax=Pseudonocardia sp. DSM 110487 TaxID=2865833 RepID=UPI0021081C4D|nr:type II toxin-antitoxin system VapC family toxin [Pseudonocardia sp. DSM 110487]
MISCDVNVLIYAHNADDPRHGEYARWLRAAVNGDRPFGLSSLVASAFVRIVTHPKVLTKPLDSKQALAAIEPLRSAPAVVAMEPGPRHWSLFATLCQQVAARGNTVSDAYLAALAIEHDAEWYSADRGFARFPGLRHHHPLDSPADEPPGSSQPTVPPARRPS